jgi:RNA polymerase sigma-70 factor (ECF subfamily)
VNLPFQASTPDAEAWHPAPTELPAELPTGPAAPVSFEAVYEETLDFVWRSVKSLGVRDHQLDDAVQDVFLVVHRRLADFEGRSSVRTWVFGIAVRVARDYRRRIQRKGGLSPLDFEVVDPGPQPDAHVESLDALREIAGALETLDEDRRDVFVLVDLEGLPVPEVAEILGIKLNTAYSRLRGARRDFQVAYEKLQGGVPR